MKLNEDSEILAENKVLILYILNKLNKPIDSDSLLKLVLSILDTFPTVPNIIYKYKFSSCW